MNALDRYRDGAAAGQPSPGWSYAWELREIERPDRFQPGGEGTLAAPIDLPGEPRAHLGSVLRQPAAAELPRKIILVDRSWSSPFGVQAFPNAVTDSEDRRGVRPRWE